MRQKSFYRFSSYLILLVGSLLLVHCNPAKRTGNTRPSNKPPTTRPVERPGNYFPMDTVRWSTPPTSAPPIGDAPSTPVLEPYTGQQYRLALLLPFLSDQADPDGKSIPQHSGRALQFYTGALLALQKLSTEEGMNLSVEVMDTRVSDYDFRRLFNNPRLDKAQVIIGPIRSSHVNLMAERIKQTNQILVSPESPIMGLTSQNPDFIQTNPSLRSHCAAITRHVLQWNLPETVTLVCQQNEANRLPYFQNSNATEVAFAELIVPDGTTSFERIDLKPYIKSRPKSVFIIPSWASQDFVMGFLRKLRASKGNTEVEVYGMPQWKGFGNIEPEYFTELNVHISSAFYFERDAAEARAFRQAFYNKTGTIPDENAYKGYDVTLFTGRMLKKYGLSFPQYLAAADPFIGIQSQYQFAKLYAVPPDTSLGAVGDAFSNYDYLENIYVNILKYENYQFVPLK